MATEARRRSSRLKPNMVFGEQLANQEAKRQLDEGERLPAKKTRFANEHQPTDDETPPPQQLRLKSILKKPVNPSTGRRAGPVRGPDLERLVPESHSHAVDKSPVEDPKYRRYNLASNEIYMLTSSGRAPDHVAALVSFVRRDRDSPGPSKHQVWRDKELEAIGMGAAASDVEYYFLRKVLAGCNHGGLLAISHRAPMAKKAVPSSGSHLQVSTPMPSMLYAYSADEVFPQQQAQLISMGTGMQASDQHEGSLYPFFVVEFKGDGGSMWAATNQCLGASATCVNINDTLNCRLRQCGGDAVQLIDSAAFSLATNGSEARLYVTWKPDEFTYHMAMIRSFLLQDAEHYLKLRKYVLNIMDWGRGRRLAEIRKSLAQLQSL
ncbi:hypothetical protein ACJZ2D_009571 [Fusarium nematophilum]